MNKKTFLVTAIIGFLFVGGVGFGYYTLKMNANSFKAIAIPVNGLPTELCEGWEAAFQEVLSDEAILQDIADETSMQRSLECRPKKRFHISRRRLKSNSLSAKTGSRSGCGVRKGRMRIY
jgi:hypothetical protein